MNTIRGILHVFCVCQLSVAMTTSKEKTVKEEMLILAQGFRDFSPWYLILLFLGLVGEGRIMGRSCVVEQSCLLCCGQEAK